MTLEELTAKLEELTAAQAERDKQIETLTAENEERAKKIDALTAANEALKTAFASFGAPQKDTDAARKEEAEKRQAEDVAWLKSVLKQL